LLLKQSLVIPEKFQHILRVMNTNIDGCRKVAFALTAIKVYLLFTEADHTIGTLDVLKACDARADMGQL